MRILSTVKRGNFSKLISWSSLIFVIKFLVVAVACIFIYNKVFTESDINDLIKLYAQLWSVVPLALLVVVVLLSGVNWGLEAFKWKFILRKHEKISFNKAVEAVLCGVTVSIAAPNRTGEFAGRIIYLEKIKKTTGALLTMIGSYSQWLITVIAGASAFALITFFKPGLLPQFYIDIFPFIIITAFVATIMFFNLNKIPGAYKFGFFHKIFQFFSILKKFTFTDLFKILSLSALRYLVFSLQFFILIYLSGMDLSLPVAMAFIAVLYLIMTFIPTTIISELPIRSSVAVFLFSFITEDSVAVINAGFLLWTINIMFPALLGAVFLLKAKIIKSPATA